MVSSCRCLCRGGRRHSHHRPRSLSGVLEMILECCLAVVLIDVKRGETHFSHPCMRVERRLLESFIRRKVRHDHLILGPNPFVYRIQSCQTPVEPELVHDMLLADLIWFDKLLSDLLLLQELEGMSSWSY